MSPRPVLAVALVALILSVAASEALAAPITGTLPAAGLDLLKADADLLTSDLVTGRMLTGLATDGFAGVPSGTIFEPFVLNLVSDADLAADFVFEHLDYGKFTAVSASITTRTADLLELFVLGVFAPNGPGLPGFDPANARIDVSVESLGSEGDALDATLVLTALPTSTVPEPGLFALLAIGGVAAARRRAARR